MANKDNKFVRHITKQYRELARENIDNYCLKRHTYLVSDSKGAAIKRVVPTTGRFHIIDKPGTRASDVNFLDIVKREISDKHKPIIIIWFGTCEITKKKDRFLELREPPYQNVADRITESIKFRDELLKVKPEAKIVFLECPYYSIKKYNCHKKGVTCREVRESERDENNNQRVIKKKHTKEDIEITIKGKTRPKRIVTKGKGKSLQVSVSVKKTKGEDPLYDTPRLNSAVDFYNKKVRALNKFDTPYLAKDILRSHKAKSDKFTKYKKDYSLYFDGIHPDRQLSKLWMYKILKLAKELNHI